jgi:putative hydrolase of HD superfamily
MIDALLKTLELKDEKRTGEQIYSIEDPATVAGHSWAVSLLVLIYGPGEELNREKALKMSVIHDLAEAETGDIPKRAKGTKEHEEKKEKELEVMNQFSSDLHTHELRELWKEYQRKETPEAKFVKDMDLVENALQALKYQEEDRYDPEDNDEDFQDLDEFFAVSESGLATEAGKEIFEEIKQRYERVKEEDRED